MKEYVCQIDDFVIEFEANNMQEAEEIIQDKISIQEVEE
jgi:hypothetical protein